MESSQYDYSQLYKIILVGDAGVGKTNLVHKFVKGTIPKNSVPTVGVEFATKTVTLATGDRIKAQIWDTAGQEQYRSITMSHYRKANGAIIVYDVSKDKTFKNVALWLEYIRELADPDVVIFLVGNKSDLPVRSVRYQDGRVFAEHQGLLFEESSVKEGNSIQTIFEKILEKINQKRRSKNQPQQHEQLRTTDKKGCGC